MALELQTHDQIPEQSGGGAVQVLGLRFEFALKLEVDSQQLRLRSQLSTALLRLRAPPGCQRITPHCISCERARSAAVCTHNSTLRGVTLELKAAPWEARSCVCVFQDQTRAERDLEEASSQLNLLRQLNAQLTNQLKLESQRRSVARRSLAVWRHDMPHAFQSCCFDVAEVAVWERVVATR